MTIDTFNKFMVAGSGKNVAILRPPREPMTPDDALMLAAWIVALVHNDERWQEILSAVENT